MEKIIGEHTYGIEHITFYQWGEGAKLKMGKFCSVAENVKMFLGGTHRTDWVSTYPFHSKLGCGVDKNNVTNGDIIIGNDVYICHGVTIMSGVTIGDGAVIAANSHIVKDVEPYSIVGGNPAQFIKHRFDYKVIELLLKLQWWDLPLNIIKDNAKLFCSAPIYEELQSFFDQHRK